MQGDMIWKTATDVTSRIFVPIGTLLSTLLLLLVGWLIARGFQLGITMILKQAGLDTLLQRLNFNQVLLRGDVKRTPAELIGDFFYWFIIFTVVITAAGVSGLAAPGQLLGAVLPYLTNVIAAIFLLGISIYLGSLIASIVLVITNNTGIAYGKTLARIAQYAVIFSAFIAAIAILGVRAEWFIASMNVVIGGIALAFAIAFGLGCKDIAGDFISNLFRQK